MEQEFRWSWINIDLLAFKLTYLQQQSSATDQ